MTVKDPRKKELSSYWVQERSEQQLGFGIVLVVRAGRPPGKQTGGGYDVGGENEYSI